MTYSESTLVLLTFLCKPISGQDIVALNHCINATLPKQKTAMKFLPSSSGPKKRDL